MPHNPRQSHPIESNRRRFRRFFVVFGCVFDDRYSHNLPRPETVEPLQYWITGEEGNRDNNTIQSHPTPPNRNETATVPPLTRRIILSCVFPRRDSHNLLRPETLESLYYLYWITGEEGYRDQAWAIFEAIEEHCRVSRGGYASLRDVTDVSSIRYCTDTIVIRYYTDRRKKTIY